MELKDCLSCKGEDLAEVFDFGSHYVSDFVEDIEAHGRVEERWPLKLNRCRGCGLTQLSHAVPRERLYRNYWYRSGVQPAMVQSLAELVPFAERYAHVHSGDWVIDIGANDGTLLAHVGARWPGTNLVAFEPAAGVRGELAQNMHDSLSRRSHVLIPDFFPSQEYAAPKAKVIFSVAMFYDLADPRAFIREVKRLLREDGVWVLQLGDLRAVIEGAFDGVCHEHLAYYTLPVLRDMIESCGLQVVGVERNQVNGGSYRLAIIQPNAHVTGDMPTIATFEAMDTVLDNEKGWHEFRVRLARVRDQVRNRIAEEWWRGGVVDALGASTKGNTLLQYFGLEGQLTFKGAPIITDPPTQIRQAYERSEWKYGKYTAGSWVKIVPEVVEDGGRGGVDLKPPTLLLVLPWHFRDALVARCRAHGVRGTLLFPLPEVEEVVL